LENGEQEGRNVIVGKMKMEVGKKGRRELKMLLFH
jgi:hypothetical protein